MAAPTYKAKGTLGYSSSTSFNFTYPTVAAYDLLFLVILETDLKSITVDSSWTLRANPFIPAGSPTMRMYVYSKLATGSESGTEAVTRSASGKTWGGQVYSFDGDNYISIESGVSNRGTSDTVTWSAVTVGGTERTLAAFVVNYDGSGITTPSGYTEKATDTISGDLDIVFECNTKENVSSDGSVTGTGGSLAGWGTYHVSIYNNTPVVIGGSRSFIVN